ncbi:MAG: hypothetical protein BWY73_01603 [candidate division TA06 bacterium ADurb.Bin417]|uniref:Uncharacterized protein n=1 Tax=candidate division TA06 bacterium ADurb.Bin417 TaxID=1852828 RepID=A0A1V5M6P8_UNCT6|nr:MAG: hypothetical protein BWY73_01603 [candidate division TA06 bacterium ADurb.Bin417]
MDRLVRKRLGRLLQVGDHLHQFLGERELSLGLLVDLVQVIHHLLEEFGPLAFDLGQVGRLLGGPQVLGLIQPLGRLQQFLLLLGELLQVFGQFLEDFDFRRPVPVLLPTAAAGRVGPAGGRVDMVEAGTAEVRRGRVVVQRLGVIGDRFRKAGRQLQVGAGRSLAAAGKLGLEEDRIGLRPVVPLRTQAEADLPQPVVVGRLDLEPDAGAGRR